MALLTAYGAVAFADFLDGVVARLLGVLTLPAVGDAEPVAVDDRYVRVVVDKAMTPPASEYRAEYGVTIRVGPAVPDADCGAGRVGWKVHRDLQIWVVTGPSLLDRAGDSTLALRTHLTQEEAVANAVVDAPPAGLANNIGLPVRATWVEGGSPPRRQDDTDVGLIQSSVVVRCEYPAVFTVNRD